MRYTAQYGGHVYIYVFKVNTNTEEEDYYCDLAVAYWYFLYKIESAKKRKHRQLHKRRFWSYEVIIRQDEYRVVQKVITQY